MTDQYVNYGVSDSVTDAVLTRRSIRAYLPQAPSDQAIRTLLQSASRAPSGTNAQPWQVYVVTGQAKEKLCNSVCTAFDEQSGQHQEEVQYYPTKWFEPYLSRRRKIGWDLYGLLGIGKGDREKTHAQHRRNFLFFDAPVGLFFTVHRDMNTGSWLDYGMFMQNIMLLAREAGMHTCAQAAWPEYHKVIREHVPMKSEEVLVSGMSLGYADPDAVVNQLVSERAGVDEFTQFIS